MIRRKPLDVIAADVGRRHVIADFGRALLRRLPRPGTGWNG
jgi:hypothetical protein